MKKQIESFLITMNGKKYHKPGCVHLPQKEKGNTMCITKFGAMMSGFTPCKFCIGKEKD